MLNWHPLDLQYWWQILFTLIVVNTLYHAPSFLSKPKKILKILTKNVNPPNWMSEQVSICWIPGLLTERKHFQVPLVIWILLDEMTLAEAVSYLFGQCVTWMLHHPDIFILFSFFENYPLFVSNVKNDLKISYFRSASIINNSILWLTKL